MNSAFTKKNNKRISWTMPQQSETNVISKISGQDWWTSLSWWQLSGQQHTRNSRINPDLSVYFLTTVFFTPVKSDSVHKGSTITDLTVRNWIQPRLLSQDSRLLTRLGTTGGLESQTKVKADNLQALHQRKANSIHVGEGLLVLASSWPFST